MCRFCNNLKQQKMSNHETGTLYRYYADLVTETLHGGLHRSVGRQNGRFELNYCPECGKKLSHFRACPFCEMEVARIRYLGTKNIYVECDKNYGGCGTSTGLYETEEEAEAAWNRRGGK